MSGDNFGYTPPPAGPYGQYDDYIKTGALDEAIDTFGDAQIRGGGNPPTSTTP